MLFLVGASLFSSVLGGVIAYSYFFNDVYNLPCFGEIEYKNGLKPGIVIREAKKVVVEQDVKINEIINNTQTSIVGIFKKVKISSNKESLDNQKFSLKEFYYVKDRVGQGLVVTSDGWIMTTFNPYKNKTFNEDKFLQNYVVATKDQIYTIDKVLVDKFGPFVFLHIDTRDLPVKSFADNDEILVGEEVIAVNYELSAWITYISYYGPNKELIKFSDENNLEIKLSNSPNKEFFGAFVFDLSGKVVAFIDSEGNIIPIDNIKNVVNSLLKYQKIKRPSLGIYYIDLQDLIRYDSNVKKGAIIYNEGKRAIVKDSVAQKAGLQKGDIIVSINNIYIDKFNDLSSVIQDYLAGDKITITYLRGGKENNVDIILDELK